MKGLTTTVTNYTDGYFKLRGLEAVNYIHLPTTRFLFATYQST